MSSTAQDSHSWNEEGRRAALAKIDNSASYSPTAEELEFLKCQTGIDDEEKLKAHVQDVQQRAFAVYPYVCIHQFRFTKPKIAHHFAYPRLLAMPASRSRAIFLDVGSFFGQDIRKAIMDGYPAKDAIASDLRQAFWDVGLELFPASQPPPFVQADILELSQQTSAPKPVSSVDLGTVTNLASLHGQVTVIHAAELFDLFNFDQQEVVARALASLLSDEPGSMIFGIHSGQPVKRAVQRVISDTGTQYCHGPDSWRALWKGIYGEGVVEVESKVIERLDVVYALVSGDQAYNLVWCVTRL
ncbi:unnamed protein product [Peniophora sp. CBMAI 1063]|nr:unnamed protein product [Peniophora sp. CBMAI 1063]